MKNKLLFLLSIILSCTAVNAQALLWEENFDSYTEDTGIRGIDATPIGGYPEGVPFIIDASDTDFSDSSSDYIKIDVSSSGTKELQMRDLEGEGVVTFDGIDISSETGDITISLGKVDYNMRATDNAWDFDEYIDLSYSLDGGDTFIIFTNHMGNGDEDHTFISPPEPVDPIEREGLDFDFEFSETFDPGDATTLIFRITGFNDSGDEEFEFDDIVISRGGMVIYSEDFESYTEDIGLEGTGSEIFQNSGDYPDSVTAWTVELTPEDTMDTSNEQLESSDDRALVESSGDEGNKVFKFDDVNDWVTLTTEEITISGEDQVTFGFAINFDDTSYEEDDFIDVFYAIDGGDFIQAQPDSGGHTYTGNVSIEEFLAAGTPDVVFSQTLDNLSASSLTIRIVASNDSSSEDYEIDFIRVQAGDTLGFDDVSLVTDLDIYPNPVTNGILNIKSKSGNIPTATFYDLAGRKVYEVTVDNEQVDINHLSSGIYLLKISQENKVLVQKIVK